MSTEVHEEQPLPEAVAELTLGDLELGSKKKKKKKDRGAELNELAAEQEALDLTSALKGKKKKRKDRSAEDTEDVGEAVAETDDAAASSGQFAWSGSSRDYTYEELLSRVFAILTEKNPELAGGKKRVLLKPPEVVREGTKKTVFVNFMELSKMMNRNSEHVQQFLLAELGTSGSLDGQSRLIIKGRFQPKNFEVTLRRYVNDYVLCHACKSMDTLLDKDSNTRLSYLRCQQCGASRSVQTIKAGFVARVAKRKH